MELRVLNYFLVIANEKNFTKASQLLHITQPTLSRQIAQLEKELGTKLFIRNNHSISLTEDGLILKRRAQEILSLADKTVKELSYNEKVLEGVINIGCGEFLSSKILGNIIAEFRNILWYNLTYTVATDTVFLTELKVDFLTLVLYKLLLILTNITMLLCLLKNFGVFTLVKNVS